MPATRTRSPRSFESHGTSGDSLPVRRSLHRLGALFLFLLLVGHGAPSLQGPASAGTGAPGDAGAARETGSEVKEPRSEAQEPRSDVGDTRSRVAEAVTRAAVLYRQFRSREALPVLEEALALAPDDREVLVWAARVSIDVGDLLPETAPHRDEERIERERLERYRAAEGYARAAARGRHRSTWPHFFLAVALAKQAEFSDLRTQIAMAGEIRREADRAIALDPDNGFAYHVLGVWHRRLAEINQAERVLALLFLQRSVPAGRLDDSVRYLEKALRYNPDVITHHLELAKTYQALGKTELARKHLITVGELPVRFSDDGIHKRDARKLLQELERNGSGCPGRC